MDNNDHRGSCDGQHFWLFHLSFFNIKLGWSFSHGIMSELLQIVAIETSWPNQIGSKIKTLCCHSWEQHMVPYVLNWHLLLFLLLLHKLKVKVMIGKISIRVFLFCSFSLITGDPSGLNQETQTRQKQRRKTVFQRKSQHKSASQSMLSFRGIHK